MAYTKEQFKRYRIEVADLFKSTASDLRNKAKYQKTQREAHKLNGEAYGLERAASWLLLLEMDD